MVKTAYAFGLRRSELCRLELADLRPNPHVPEWGTYGSLHVRYGKAIKGGVPRRRTVLAVPEFDWVIKGLRQWVEEGRPYSRPGDHTGLWVTERLTRVALKHFDKRFNWLRAEAGLDPALTLHCLRHSYVSHLVEFGYPERFVQEQVGHAYASTTAIYTSVSNDFKNKTLQAALARVYTRLKRRNRDGTPDRDAWNLRQVMATGTVPDQRPGAPAGRTRRASHPPIRPSAGDQPPQRVNIDLLAALCDILDCEPSDLLSPGRGDHPHGQDRHRRRGKDRITTTNPHHHRATQGCPVISFCSASSPDKRKEPPAQTRCVLSRREVAKSARHHRSGSQCLPETVGPDSSVTPPPCPELRCSSGFSHLGDADGVRRLRRMRRRRAHLVLCSKVRPRGQFLWFSMRAM